MVVLLLSIAGVIFLGLAVYLARRAGRLSIVSVDTMTPVRDKATKQALVRGRGERQWLEWYQAGRSHLFGWWRFVKRAARPIYYWALQRVDVQVDLPKPVRVESEVKADVKKDVVRLEEDLLVERVNKDPKDLIAFLGLVELYVPNGKLDEATEILAHVRKMVSRHPGLIEQYFPDRASFFNQVTKLERATSLTKEG